MHCLYCLQNYEFCSTWLFFSHIVINIFFNTATKGRGEISRIRLLIAVPCNFTVIIPLRECDKFIFTGNVVRLVQILRTCEKGVCTQKIPEMPSVCCHSPTLSVTNIFYNCVTGSVTDIYYNCNNIYVYTCIIVWD